MELRRLERLAALEYRIDTATDKLRGEIKIGLMDVAQAIEEIKLQLQEVQESQRGNNA